MECENKQRPLALDVTKHNSFKGSLNSALFFLNFFFLTEHFIYIITVKTLKRQQ